MTTTTITQSQNPDGPPYVRWMPAGAVPGRNGSWIFPLTPEERVVEDIPKRFPAIAPHTTLYTACCKKPRWAKYVYLVITKPNQEACMYCKPGRGCRK